MATRKIIFEVDVRGGRTVTEIQRDIKALKNEIKSTDDPQALKNLETSLAKLQGELKGARDQNRLLQKEFASQDQTVGAYSRLSQQLQVARTRLKDLAAEGRTSGKEFDRLSAEVTQLDKRLKGIDASVGQFQRNVGNYTNSLGGFFKNLRRSIVNIRFIERLPFLFTDITQTLEQIGQALDFIDVALNDSLKTQRELSKVIKDNSANYLEQVGTLENLFDVAQDQNRSDQERQAALDAINNEYGELLPNEREQLTLTSDLTAAQNKLNNAIIQQIVAEQQRIKAQEAIQQFIARQRAAVEAQESTIQQFVLSTTLGFDTASEEFEKLLETTNVDLLQKELGDVAKFGEDLQNALGQTFEALEQTGVDIGDIFGQTADEVQEQTKNISTNAAKTNEVLTNTLESLKNQLSETQRAIQQTDIADRNAIEALIGTETELKDQIRVAEEQINALRGITDQEAEKQAQQAQENANRLLAIRNELLLSEVELQRQAAVQAQAAQQAEIEELATNEAEKAELIKASQEALEAELLQINIDGARRVAEARLSEIQQGQAAIEQELLLSSLQIEEQIARGTISAAEGARQLLDIQVQALKDQLAQLEDEEALTLELGVELSAQEQQQLIEQRQQLNTQLAQLEAEYTETVKAEGEKQLSERQKAITGILNGVSQGLQIIEGFAQASQERTQQRLEARQEERENNIAILQEELNSASGLQAAFIQEQIEAEKRQIQELEKAKEQADRRSARLAKTIAVSESIINTAVAVTAALPNVPLAIATGIFGAAQTAVIAAQPLATGGIVGKNIKGRSIRRSNGDDTLTTLKTGEVVLNKKQQQRLGGAATFRSIGVPGFVGGGVVGSPAIAPRVPSVVSGGAGEFEELRQLIIDTNKLARRNATTEVVFTPNTQRQIDDDDRDRKEIQSLSNL